MSNIKIAKRYAQALFENALSNKQVEEVKSALESIKQTINQNPELSSLLKNQVVDSESKAKVFLQIFKGTHTSVESLIQILCNKRREYCLEEVIGSFITLYNQYHSKIFVEVKSAMPLNEGSIAAIKNIVTEKTGAKIIEISNPIEQDLLGGMVVRFGDNLIDTSIKSKINNIKKEFKIA